jgi:hypothetical protein
MTHLIEIIKSIDISKYNQDEYRNIVDAIVQEWKLQHVDEILNKAGWLDIGGSG